MEKTTQSRTPPKSRKPHRKTRTGCTSCKKGKVKCNESKPYCGYCERHGYECVYVTPPSRPKVTVSEIYPMPKILQTSIGPRSTGASARNLNMLDLELLHLYTTSTCFTFSKIPQSQEIWQRTVPRLAFSDEFLLHGILGISALHLSRLSAGRKDELRAAASVYHSAAVTKLRLAISGISSENVHACCVFTTLVNIHRWAYAEGTESLFFVDATEDLEGDSVEWVQLLRGGAGLIRTYLQEVNQGPASGLFDWDTDAEDFAKENPKETTRFEALEQLWNTADSPTTTLDIDALKETLGSLITMYTLISAPNIRINTVSIGLAWLTRIPERFISMVRERHPFALILLAHYCLVLNKIDDFWWIQGISRNLLHRIHNAIGDKWEPWIKWPLQDLILLEFRKSSAEVES